MQITLLLLSIAPLTTILAQGLPSVFDYDQLPSCARSCKPLETAELNCVPPAAPLSNQATYVDCLCQSDYLRSLHANGEICHSFCDDKDDIVIYHYYNTLCATPYSTPISIPRPTATLSPSRAAGPSGSATPTSINDHQDESKDQGTLFQRNWKYLLIAFVLILSILLVFFGFACYRRRCRRKLDLESSNKRDRLIPLQLVHSRSRQPLSPSAQSDWPLRAPSTAGQSTYDLRSPSISSPLAPPTPTYSFGNSHRQLEDREDKNLRRISRTVPGTRGRSLEDTERLIRDRMRATGRPDIPLSATPRIRR